MLELLALGGERFDEGAWRDGVFEKAGPESQELGPGGNLPDEEPGPLALLLEDLRVELRAVEKRRVACGAREFPLLDQLVEVPEDLSPGYRRTDGLCIRRARIADHAG